VNPKAMLLLLSVVAASSGVLATASEGTAPPSGSDLIPIRRVEPQFPREAIVEGISGYVVLEGIVDEKGNVKTVQVIESKPKFVFDASALRAVKQWKFKPRILDGVAVERPFTQRLDYQIGGSRYAVNKDGDGYSERLADASMFERPALDEFYAGIRALCPDVYRRADDAPNVALALAAKPTADAPRTLPEDNLNARSAMLKADNCLFSSWEHLKDPKAFELAARFVEFEPRPEKRSSRISNSLKAYATSLAGTPIEPQLLLPARAWMFARLTPGYFELVFAHSATLPKAAEIAGTTRDAIAEANRALTDRGPVGARKVLNAALKAAPPPVDRCQLLLALARVHALEKDYDDALERLAEASEIADAPWNIRMSALIGRATLCGRDDRIECFDVALATLNRELAVEDRLAF